MVIGPSVGSLLSIVFDSPVLPSSTVRFGRKGSSARLLYNRVLLDLHRNHLSLADSIRRSGSRTSSIRLALGDRRFNLARIDRHGDLASSLARIWQSTASTCAHAAGGNRSTWKSAGGAASTGAVRRLYFEVIMPMMKLTFLNHPSALGSVW